MGSGVGLELVLSSRAEGDGFTKTRAEIVGLEAAVGAAQGAVEGLVLGFASFKTVSFLKDLVMQGVNFNAQMETSKLGIASLISSFNKITYAGHEVTDANEKMNASLKIATDVQQQLQVAALKTTATYEDLLRAFQEGAAPAFAAGFDTKQLVHFSQTFAQTMAAMGIPLAQIGQEMRGFFQVDMSKNSRVANALLRSTGQSAAELRKEFAELAKTGKLAARFDQYMAPFAKTGELAAKSFTGALSNLKDGIAQALGSSTQETTKGLTKIMLDLTAQIVTFDAAGKATFNAEFVQNVKNVAEVFETLAGWMAKVAGFMASWDTGTAGSPVFMQRAQEEERKRRMGEDIPLMQKLRRRQAWEADPKASTKSGGHFLSAPPELTEAENKQLTAQLKIISSINYARDHSLEQEEAHLKSVTESEDRMTQLIATTKQKSDVDDAARKKAAAELKSQLKTLEQLAFAQEILNTKIKAEEGFRKQETVILNQVFDDESAHADALTAAENKRAASLAALPALMRPVTALQSASYKEQIDANAKEERRWAKTEAARAKEIVGIDNVMRHEKLAADIQARVNSSVTDRQMLRLQLAKQLVQIQAEETAALRPLEAITAPGAQKEKEIQIQLVKQNAELKRNNAQNDYGAKLQSQALRAAKELLDLKKQGANADQQAVAAAQAAVDALDAKLNAISFAAYAQKVQLLADEMRNGISGAFDTLAKGGKTSEVITSFFDGFSKGWAQTLKDMVSKWTDSLAIMATDEASTWKDGVETKGKKGSTKAKVGLGVMAVVGAAWGIYELSKKETTNREATQQGAMLGAQAGAQIAGVYGAIIGAVIGGIAGYLTGGKKVGYTVTVKDGKMEVTGLGKAKAVDVAAAQKAIEQAIAIARSSAQDILAAFPLAILQGLNKLTPADLFGDAVYGPKGPPPKGIGSTVGPRGDMNAALHGGYLVNILKSIKKNLGGLSGDQLKDFIENKIPEMVFDAYAPIFKAGLTQLGVTKSRLAELFEKGPGFDPKAAMARIKEYITVLVGLDDMVKFLGKASDAKSAFAAGEANKTPMDHMNDIAQQIAELANGFAELPLDEQITTGHKIFDLTKQRYDMEIAYLQEIDTTIKAIRQSTEDLNQQITITNLGKGTGGPHAQLVEMQSRQTKLFAQLAAAKTPAEVARLTQELQSNSMTIFGLMNDWNDALKAVSAGLGTAMDFLHKSLADKFAKAAEADFTPAQKIGAIDTKISALATGFSDQTIDEQMRRGKEVQSLMEERYTIELDYLKQIKDVGESIHKSIAEQIFGIRQDQRNPDEQIAGLQGHQRELRAQLEMAKTPAEVAEIVRQMQGNATELYNMMGKTPEAAAQIVKMLEDIEKVSSKTLTGLGDDLQKKDDILYNHIKDVFTKIGLLFPEKPKASGKPGMSFGQGIDEATGLPRLDPNSDPTTYITGMLANIQTVSLGVLDQLKTDLFAADALLYTHISGVFDALQGVVEAALPATPPVWYHEYPGWWTVKQKDDVNNGDGATGGGNKEAVNVTVNPPTVNVVLNGSMAAVVAEVTQQIGPPLQASVMRTASRRAARR